MKYLILAFLLMGCTVEPDSVILTNPNTLKFKAGDSVTTTTGFYSNCLGFVSNYAIGTNVKMGPKYTVNFICGNIVTNEVEILESELRMAK